MPRCTVLPPGEFIVMILEPLPIYSESFMAIAVIILRNVAMLLVLYKSVIIIIIICYYK